MPRASPPSPDQEVLLDKAAAVAVERRQAEARYNEALERYNAVLVEAYSAGLRFSQIAERVGTSGEAVRRIIARALGEAVNSAGRDARTRGAVSDPDETVSPPE